MVTEWLDVDSGRSLRRHSKYTAWLVIGVFLLAFISAGCKALPAAEARKDANSTPASQPAPGYTGDVRDGTHAEQPFTLHPVSLEPGEKLRVVATTGIVADVVGNVGGDAIELAALMPIGADPHGFTPTPQDMRTLNDAHVIFLNGLGLEESLQPILENLDRPVPLVSVNDGVDTLRLGVAHGGDDAGADLHGEEEHSEGGADPHTWFSVPNVSTWADNIAAALGELDPGRAREFDAAAGAYKAQLDELDADLRAMVEALPAEDRKLVTDHVALAYLADEYGFEIVGSVLPSLSTLAAASAQELAALQEAIAEEDVRALFVSTTVNPQTVDQLAKDLGIPVVEIYTGSLSEAGGPAPTYIELMRYDVTQIVDALR